MNTQFLWKRKSVARQRARKCNSNSKTKTNRVGIIQEIDESIYNIYWTCNDRFNAIFYVSMCVIY